MNNEEIQIIVKYEMSKVINQLIERVKYYDCTDHQSQCAIRGKSPEECKGAQATAKAILQVIEDWQCL